MPLRPFTHPVLPQIIKRLKHAAVSPDRLAKPIKQRLISKHAAIPPYPYGPSQIYKQSNLGLYGTKKIRFGNMVSEKNEIKTRRHWRPNVHFKRLWSVSLGQFIRIRITASVLRTVDRCGGLDEYLLGEKAQRIKELGMEGWRLRWRIMQTDSIKERFRRQRQMLGLNPVPQRGLTLASEADVASLIKDYDEELMKGPGIDIGDNAEGEVMGEEVVDNRFMEEQPGNAQPPKDQKTVL